MSSPAKKIKPSKKSKPSTNTGWLQVIESEPPRFFCPIIQCELAGPCELRGCFLWTNKLKVYNCAGAFGSMKAANSEERLQNTSAAQRAGKGTLRSAAGGKLSFYDIAYLFGLSRQRVEGFVSHGRQTSEVLAPLFSDIELDGEERAHKRIGSPTLFTYTSPSSHTNEDGEVTRICINCECVIDPDDTEQILAIVDRSEVAWCSRECNREFTIDAYLVADRYSRHWVQVAAGNERLDERSRVREIDRERMNALKQLAIDQGYNISL